MILGGDVGATKTHLALFEIKDKRKWVADEKFKSREHESLIAIVRQFLSKHSAKIEKVCFGVPGVVINGRCHPTNLPWVVEADEISKELGIKSVQLINDLEANAYGIGCLSPDELVILNQGKKLNGNQAIISAGTGLGQAGIFWNGSEHIPFATEGGHASFAPVNEIEISLLQYLKKEFDHISFERILSGSGLVRLYQFLIESGHETEKEDLKKAIKEGDSPRMITDFGSRGVSRACKKALQLFVSIYGSEAGNLAMKMLAIGGLYIGGGIAPKILKEMKEGEFMRRFTAKGRMKTFLSEIPVSVIMNENTALLGTAEYARKKIL